MVQCHDVVPHEECTLYGRQGKSLNPCSHIRSRSHMMKIDDLKTWHFFAYPGTNYVTPALSGYPAVTSIAPSVCYSCLTSVGWYLFKRACVSLFLLFYISKHNFNLHQQQPTLNTSPTNNQTTSRCLHQTLTSQMRASSARPSTLSRTPPTTSQSPSRAPQLRPARKPTSVCFTRARS